MNMSSRSLKVTRLQLRQVDIAILADQVELKQKQTVTQLKIEDGEIWKDYVNQLTREVK